MLPLHPMEKPRIPESKRAILAGASILGMVFVRLTTLEFLSHVPVTLDYRPLASKPAPRCLNSMKWLPYVYIKYGI